MNREHYGGSSYSGTSTSSMSLFASSVVNRHHLAKKEDDKKMDNHVLPNRRRSRLGTYRASLMNQDFPLHSEENSNSVKKVLSEKKSVPAVTPYNYDDRNTCVKKQLFTPSTISRKLNMDTSSIIQESTENQEPDVTGINFLENAQSSKKTSESVADNDRHCVTGNRKYLSSVENNPGKHLRSAKKKSPPSKFNLSKSPRQVMLRKVQNNETVQVSNQFSSFCRKTIKTPSPPKPYYFRSRTLQVVKTPELLPSAAAALAAIGKKRCTTNSGNGESSNKLHADVATNVNKVSEINVSKDILNSNVDGSLLRKPVGSKMSDNNICLENFSNTETASTDCKVKTVSNDRSVNNIDKNTDSKGVNSFAIVRNLSLDYEPNNSLEAAYARVNGTYDIIETTDKIEETSVVDLAENNKYAVECNINEEVIESNNKISEKHSPPKDRSPSFIVFNKKVNIKYELDDTTESFIYNESLCNDETLKLEDPNVSSSMGSESTIKKKKLSMIPEDLTAQLPSTSTCCSIPLETKVNETFNTSMQLTTCETDTRRNANNITSSVHNLLLKMCDTMKLIEKSNLERESFSRRHNDIIDNLKCETQQFLNQQRNSSKSIINSLNELNNEIKVLVNSTDNNSSFNSTLINEVFKDTEKIINSTDSSVGVLKTPENIRRTLSKSVYNQLKTEYTCLKTPKPSTMKKNTASSRKILTPHSMSLCVQDQVDQLFDE